MRRLAYALLFAGLVAGAHGQDASQKVTFTCRAARAERVLSELGKAANLNLMVSPKTADEILVISAKDVPVSDLMSRIATATSAEWRAEDGGYRLVPAVGVRTREENEALNERVAAIRKIIGDEIAKSKPPKGAALTKPAKPGKESDEEETTIVPDRSDATIYEIAAKTDVAAIAALGNGERVVFSTQPTRAQRRFSGDITALVNKLVADHNKQAAQSPAGADGPEFDKLPDFIKEMAARNLKPVGQVSKALFVVSRLGLGLFGMTQAELRLYDPAGKVALHVPVMLNIPGNDLGEFMESGVREQMEQALGNKGAVKKDKPATTTPVEISPDTKAFMEAFGSGGMMGMTAGRGLKMSDSIREKLFRPDLYDPLSYLPTDQVLSLAKKQNRPVVAALPDGSLSLMSNIMATAKPTVEGFEKDLAKGSTSKIVPDDRWLVIKPANPSEARASRLDRQALTALLAATAAKGMPSLDDVAAYSLKAPSPMEGGLGSLYVMFLVPGAVSQGLSGFTSWETLRFYGSLEPNPRRVLMQGGRIPFSALTPYQQEQVRRMAYGSMPSLEVEEPGKKSSGLPPFMMGLMGGMGGDYRTEPTELLPTGLPGNGYVELKASQEPFASPVMPEGTVSAGTMAILDADMLATLKMFKEDAGSSPFAGMMPNFEKVRIGSKGVLAFTFQVAPNVAMHQSLSDHSLAKDAPIVSMHSLPANFERLIAERQVALKKSPLGALMGMAGAFRMGGGQIKP